MKRASYRHGIAWIGENDESGCLDSEEMSKLISVCLLADLFHVPSMKVAEDVVRYRQKHF